MNNKTMNISKTMVITLVIIFVASLSVGFFTSSYIMKNNDKIKNYSLLEAQLDSVKVINEGMKMRIQTSLDSINAFHKKYEDGEYELTYPDSILSAVDFYKLDQNGNLDYSVIEPLFSQIKERTRSTVLVHELAKGNYDFYVNSINAEPRIAPTFGVVTSTFGYRNHPIFKRRIFHRGLDIANDLGTPIYSTADGVVIKNSYDSHYGRYIRILHSNGYETRYAHLNKRLVKVGSIVKAGEIIGEMGKSGTSTGVHLHYEVRKNKSLKNPWYFVNKSLKNNPKKKFI